VNVAWLQLESHLPAVMSAQLVPLRQLAQLSSGLPQLASHDNPAELRSHD
jgi:hypothetical protein